MEKEKINITEFVQLLIHDNEMAIQKWLDENYVSKFDKQREKGDWYFVCEYIFAHYYGVSHGLNHVGSGFSTKDRNFFRGYFDYCLEQKKSDEEVLIDLGYFAWLFIKYPSCKDFISSFELWDLLVKEVERKVTFSNFQQQSVMIGNEFDCSRLAFEFISSHSWNFDSRNFPFIPVLLRDKKFLTFLHSVFTKASMPESQQQVGSLLDDYYVRGYCKLGEGMLCQIRSDLGQNENRFRKVENLFFRVTEGVAIDSLERFYILKSLDLLLKFKSETEILEIWTKSKIWQLTRIIQILESYLGKRGACDFILDDSHKGFFALFCLQFQSQSSVLEQLTEHDIYQLLDMNRQVGHCFNVAQKEGLLIKAKSLGCLNEFLEYISPLPFQENEKVYSIYKTKYRLKDGEDCSKKWSKADFCLLQLDDYFIYNDNFLEEVFCRDDAKEILQRCNQLRHLVVKYLPIPWITSETGLHDKTHYYQEMDCNAYTDYHFQLVSHSYTKKVSYQYKDIEYPYFEIFQIKEAIKFVETFILTDLDSDYIWNLIHTQMFDNFYLSIFAELFFEQKKLDSNKVRKKTYLDCINKEN